MATPTPAPDGDQVSTIATFLAWIRDWGWGAVGGVGVPIAWNISGRLTKIEQRIEQHASKFEDQVATNREIRDRISGLADKDDVKELKDDIRDLGRRVDENLRDRRGNRAN